MFKSIIFLIISLATIFYAIPRIEFFSPNLTATIFSVVWLIFALLIVGSHLDQLLILDEEKRKRLKRLKRYYIWKREQSILQVQTQQIKRVKGIG